MKHPRMTAIRGLLLMSGDFRIILKYLLNRYLTGIHETSDMPLTICCYNCKHN